MDFEASSNANIQATTREMFLSSIVPQVFQKMALLTRLLLAKRMPMLGGKYITRPVDKAEMDDLMQSYKPGQPMSQGRKTMLETPYFHWKLAQLGASYDVEEELQNTGAGANIAPVQFVKFLVQKAHRATRLGLYKMMYGTHTNAELLDGTTTDNGKDHGAEFQSIRHALVHGAASDDYYGHVARNAATTNSWWQGGSIGTITGTNKNNDYNTARTPSIATLRKARSAIDMYVDKPGDLLCVVGPNIFLELQSQVEARHIYSRDGSLLAKYGFNAMMIDGIEIVQDSFLTAGLVDHSGTTLAAEKWMLLLNIPDWELRLHPKRAFKFTGFTWQGDRQDGYDEWLARIMIAGNLICWKPNGSIFLNNVS